MEVVVRSMFYGGFGELVLVIWNLDVYVVGLCGMDGGGRGWGLVVGDVWKWGIEVVFRWCGVCGVGCDVWDVAMSLEVGYLGELWGFSILICCICICRSDYLADVLYYFLFHLAPPYETSGYRRAVIAP